MSGSGGSGGGGGVGGGSGGGVRRGSHSDEERKPSLALDEDACSEGSGDARLGTEELLAEAAMRSALAAEKQAEAVAQVRPQRPIGAARVAAQ